MGRAIFLRPRFTGHYIIGVKPGDHAFLFQQLRDADEAGQTQTLTLVDEATGVLHHFRFHNSVPLNESHQDVLVNVREYWEVHPAKIVKKVRREGHRQYFSWITNTLKNQGYHLEHNDGHGEQHLSVVLMMLMMLALLVDQTQQLSCPIFRGAWKRQGTKRHLWEKIRTYFVAFVFDSMTELLTALVRGIAPQSPVWSDSS